MPLDKDYDRLLTDMRRVPQVGDWCVGFLVTMRAVIVARLTNVDGKCYTLDKEWCLSNLWKSEWCATFPTEAEAKACFERFNS